MADRVTLDSPSLSGGVRRDAPRRSGLDKKRAGQDVVRPNRQPRNRLGDYQRRPQVTQQTVKKRIINEVEKSKVTKPAPAAVAERTVVAQPAPVSVPKQPVVAQAATFTDVNKEAPAKLDLTDTPKDYLPQDLTEQNPHAYDNQTAEAVSEFDPTNPFGDSRLSSVVNHLKDRGLYYLAGFLFLVGMLVAINALRVSLMVDAQVKSFRTQTRNYTLGEPIIEDDDVISEEENTEPISEYSVEPDEARVIRIPKLNIEARVGLVGRTDDGAVDVPDSFFDVARFDESVKPTADDGAMFIVGHNVAYTGKAVFFNLEKLEQGDLIEIERGDGVNLVFRVISNDSYPIGNVDMAAAVRAVNPHKLGLNLMTCGGEYDEDDDTYDERVLIRTELVTITD